jgi:hypothetical protein
MFVRALASVCCESEEDARALVRSLATSSDARRVSLAAEALLGNQSAEAQSRLAVAAWRYAEAIKDMEVWTDEGIKSIAEEHLSALREGRVSRPSKDDLSAALREFERVPSTL